MTKNVENLLIFGPISQFLLQNLAKNGENLLIFGLISQFLLQNLAKNGENLWGEFISENF